MFPYEPKLIRAPPCCPTKRQSDAQKLGARPPIRGASRLTAHSVALDLQRDVLLVDVDPVLVERALGQLLENAAKYSPAGTKIEIRSRRREDYVELSVTDQGRD